ncbi:MAG TPA: hypothetical protein VNI20_03895 [Fimbriimonadaceae bacterium]|nr:hypothetical protein [Fimbriimonadaceae bacterium]
MLGLIGYAVAGFAVAAVLTVVYALFRPIKKNDDILSWRVFAVIYVLTLVGPYLYVEFMTHMYGAPMLTAIKDTVYEESPAAKFDYYKVLRCKDDKARVLAVFTERSKWGADEHTVMAMDLEKKNGKWESTDFNWVTSDMRNKDSTPMPPYW